MDSNIIKMPPWPFSRSGVAARTHTYITLDSFNSLRNFPGWRNPLRNLEMRIFYPPPSEKLKIKTPFVGRRGPQARLAKPLGNLEMRFPLRKIKNQYSPLGRRRPHALFAKPSEILKCKFFAPPWEE